MESSNSLWKSGYGRPSSAGLFKAPQRRHPTSANNMGKSGFRCKWSSGRKARNPQQDESRLPLPALYHNETM
jgi:hypothetical protein